MTKVFFIFTLSKKNIVLFSMVFHKNSQHTFTYNRPTFLLLLSHSNTSQTYIKYNTNI